MRGFPFSGAHLATGGKTRSTFAPADGGCHMCAYPVDIIAVAFFTLEWTVYAVTLEQ
jgi:hypothetical protein